MNPNDTLTPSSGIHGLIMAAGASRRMGRPKALLSLGNQTFAERLIDGFSAVCDTVTIVTGAHHALIRARLDGTARLVHASDWYRGMRASLRVGLLAIPSGPVLMTHVDRPSVHLDTIKLMASTPGNRPVIPLYRGRVGHPVRIPDWLRKRLILNDQTPLREVFKKAGFIRLDVPDPGVIENINSQRDYDTLRAR